MKFIIRGAKREDLGKLYDLARQFTLLNLPAEKRVIAEKIEKSIASFQGELDKAEAEYLFIAEDLQEDYLVGSSQIVAKQGTQAVPAFSFEVKKRERFSEALGVGFIHQILRLKVTTDGPTEVGGLVVDRAYRRIPEKVGKMVSLSRFIYIGVCPERFEKELHAEMAPPLTEEGRSEFWEALGRRFTGMPYAEADALSQQNKEFIKSLFPEEDIYLCLLDAKARLVLGRVGEQTQAALHMLERLGFKYKEEVDPFDGGPHLSVPTQEVSIIKNLKSYKAKAGSSSNYQKPALIGLVRDSEYLGGSTSYALDGDQILFPEPTWKALSLEEGENIYLTAF